MTDPPTAEPRRRSEIPAKAFDLLAHPGVMVADLDIRRLGEVFDFNRVSLRPGQLEALGLITSHQGQVRATNAGVILFGQDAVRRRYFHDAHVEGVRFAGTSGAAGIQDVFDPDEELTVLEAVDAIERFVSRNTRQAEPIPEGSLQREPRPEYSRVMVRELLVNSVAHADYSDSGETIKVSIFDGRIEISSPGPMSPGATTDDIRGGRSKIRNQGITNVLQRIRYMERRGTAWQKIKAEMAHGYPEPLLDGNGPVFTATVWPHPSFTRGN